MQHRSEKREVRGKKQDVQQQEASHKEHSSEMQEAQQQDVPQECSTEASSELDVGKF
jgi:hypothetical protein